MNAPFSLETTPDFDKSMRKLDPSAQRKISAYLTEVLNLPDPRLKGKALAGNHAGIWRYRVGDYRVLTEIIDERLVVLAIYVAHRSRAY